MSDNPALKPAEPSPAPVAPDLAARVERRAASQNDWSLQVILNMQQTLGTMQASLEQTKRDMRRLDAQVEQHVRLQHMVWGGLIVIGIFITAAWNVVGDNFKIPFKSAEAATHVVQVPAEAIPESAGTVDIRPPLNPNKYPRRDGR